MSRVPRPQRRQIALEDLFAGFADARIIGDPGVLVTGLELDSRQIESGDLFAALPGHHMHGVQFAWQAVERGAAAVVTDAAGAEQLRDLPVTVVILESPRRAMGTLSAALYGTADRCPTLLGVTGTNGKTTVTYMLEAGLRASGLDTGVIGTIGTRIGDQELVSERTTPEATHLHALLGYMAESAVDAVAMEVSSHALCEGRVDALIFDVAGFTNLSQDHLDYHGSMEEYFNAKALLFTPRYARRGVVGIDDAWGRRLAEIASIPITTWSLDRESGADWTLVHADDRWLAVGPGGERQALSMQLPGAFNRANAICAYAMLRTVGVPAHSAASGIGQAQVPGRMELVGSAGGVAGIVDYAHTPDAIERVVGAAREQCEGRLIVVIGAGGDRDRVKRPLMGAAAARLADRVIITDDNPRSEDPAAIRAAVLEGTALGSAEVLQVPDRRAAINHAVLDASAGDVVLLLGKGHESGQEIAGVVHPFDDRVELRVALAQLAAHP